MAYLIYLHRNKINNKVYIGLTEFSLEKRWDIHKKRAKYDVKKRKAQYFHYAIVKHGADNWLHETLEINIDTLKQAEERETYWIAYYKSNDRRFGYNLTAGGNASRGHLNSEVRAKISATVKKQVNDPLRKQRHSQFMKEYFKTHDNPFQNKKHSDETLKKLSEKSKAWHTTHDNPFLGKTHDEETKARMKIAATERCKDPNWVSPLTKLTKEQRAENNRNKKTQRKSELDLNKILTLAATCETKAALAKALEISAAHLSWALKRFNIKDEVERLMNKVELSADFLIQESAKHKNKAKMATALGYSQSHIGGLIKKFGIEKQLQFNKG